MREHLTREPAHAVPPLAERKAKVLDVLQRQQLAVISTVGKPNPARCYPNPDIMVPESALVAFTQEDDLRLYFQTGRHTRKAQNLAVNPDVSFVISHTVGADSPYPDVTVQYQGRARRLYDDADLEACKERFVAKDSPTTEKFFNDPTAIFFEVVPVWIGCSDYSTEPPNVQEIDFWRDPRPRTARAAGPARSHVATAPTRR